MPLSHPLQLKDYLHDRPEPRGIDILCKLQHFAIITYAVDPERFKGIMPSLVVEEDYTVVRKLDRFILALVIANIRVK